MTTPGRWIAHHVEAWTERSFTRWLCLCDICHRRRLVARYHEVYTDDATWRYGCRACVYEILAEKTRLQAEELKRRSWFCGYDEDRGGCSTC